MAPSSPFGGRVRRSTASSGALSSTAPSGVPSGGTTAAPEPFGATVLIGTGGITWTDVSEKATPNLWQLLRDGSSAAMSIRSVDTNTCPLDGWLGVSAANRAAAPRSGTGPVQQRPCAPIEEPQGGVVPRWDEFVEAADSRKFDSQLGLLGEAAEKSNICIKPVGPGAAGVTGGGAATAASGAAASGPGTPGSGSVSGACSGCSDTVVSLLRPAVGGRPAAAGPEFLLMSCTSPLPRSTAVTCR